MPVNKLIINMSIPIMISMLIQALYNIIDSMYVAQINENALTALSLVFPIQSLMIAIAAGTGVGMNALLSRSLGQRNTKKANHVAMHGLFLAVCSSVLFIVFAWVLAPSYFAMQGVQGEVYEYGLAYTQIVCTFSIGIFVQIALERLLQATGRSFHSMLSQITGAVINIILDPILIFGWFGLPAMGVEGAAIATIIGQFSACAMGYYFNQTLNKEVKLSIKLFALQWQTIKEIYLIGIPSIIMGSITSVMTFGMNQILLSFSQTATAFFGVYIKLQSFAYMPIIGLNNAVVPIVAYNYGACLPKRIHKTIQISIIFASIILGFCFILFQVFPQEALSIFNASPEMYAIGVPALRIISYHFLLAGVSMILGSAFQALGHSFSAMMISICRQLVILLPIAYLLSLSGAVNNIWYSYLIAELVCLVLSVTWQQVKVKKQINEL